MTYADEHPVSTRELAFLTACLQHIPSIIMGWDDKFYPILFWTDKAQTHTKIACTTPVLLLGLCFPVSHLIFLLWPLQWPPQRPCWRALFCSGPVKLQNSVITLSTHTGALRLLEFTPQLVNHMLLLPGFIGFWCVFVCFFFNFHLWNSLSRRFSGFTASWKSCHLHLWDLLPFDSAEVLATLRCLDDELWQLLVNPESRSPDQFIFLL